MQKHNRNNASAKRNSPKQQEGDPGVSYLRWSYCDLPIPSTAVSSTNADYQIEENAMELQFSSFPQVFTPIMGGSTSSVVNFKGRVKYHRLEMRMNCVGSQGNLLAAADYYNRIRLVVCHSPSNYKSSPTFNAITTDTILDRRDFDYVFLDEIEDLQSSAFDSSDYNVPGMRTITRAWSIPRSISVKEVYSTSNGASWDTRVGSFHFLVVSDSSTTPHPYISGMFRLYYSILP